MPPSEGLDVAELGLRVEAVPAGQAVDGRRRFGLELSDVDGDQHGFDGVAAEHLR
jgi:hypothetical protein